MDCFFDRQPLEIIPALLRARDQSAQDCVWAWHQGIRGPDGKGALCQPLHNRGWVVQERAMSPRTLDFGPDMIFWECLEGKASEMTPEMTVVDFSPGPLGWSAFSASKMGPESLLQAIRSVKDRGWEQWESIWWQLVREYTRCKLTNRADKWNAISAMAMEVERETGLILYHGLWSENLVLELLWSTDQIGPERIGSFPSWPWLSLDTAVHEHRYSKEVFKTIAAVTIPPGVRLGEDGLGSSRELVIFGAPINVSWKMAIVNGKAQYRFDNQNQQPFETRQHDYCRWKPDVPLKDDWELSILPFIVSKGQSRGFESYGLVVRQVNGRNWTRVGFYQMTCHLGEGDNRDYSFEGEIRRKLFLI